MAVDKTDGCIPSKMSSPEEMEVTSQDQDGNGPVSQNASSRGNSPGSAGVSQEGEWSHQPLVTSDGEGQILDLIVQDSVTMTQEAATQPMDSSIDLDPSSQGLEEGVWGQLYPHCGSFPRIPLKTDVFRFGRASSCDYVIRETDMGDKKWLTAVSKIQCEIIKTDEGVFVKDRSSNGTWVNGHKICKENKWPLEHNAEICFAGARKKVFVFMSNMEEGESFPEALTNKYTVSKVLGRGAHGEVRLGFRIPDLNRFAIKLINKRTCGTISDAVSSSDDVLNEVKILKSVSHPNVINLVDVIDTPDYLYIVLELAEGGELFDKIIEKTRFNESEAKLHFYQMASAMQYLHSKKICHRDLKPENILLCSLDDKNPVIKITDMGLSKLVDLGTVLKTFCGTPQYIAPEVIKGSSVFGGPKPYSLKVDCWGLGVILYILLSGTPPFSEDRRIKQELKDQILTANYTFYPQLFDSISVEAKDLIQKCLKVEPSERISAEEIMNHPWLTNDSDVIERARVLMSSQMKGKKRLLEECDDSTDGSHGHDAKKHRNEIFKPPLDP